ncbi:MAG: methyltransferase domain-containing protein [Chloroflexi bacterium]|nr:methyltransferase domain-containing protein [Chloroflexota bacterium]
METLLIFIGVLVSIGLVGLLLWWLINATEGVYLGRRVVIWLYDRYAHRYDRTKEFETAYETAYLGRPLLQALDTPNALILDVATGTGRLPATLFQRPAFTGKIVAVDLSRQMLTRAAAKLQYELDANRAYLLHCPADHLPFPDNTFEAVTILEALEFMPSPEAVLREIQRVTRPGGVVLMSNRQGREAKLLPGKTMSNERFEHYLTATLGFEFIEIEKWQVGYALVWAFKAGDSATATARPLGEIWRCPTCDQIALVPQPNQWICTHCGQTIPVGADGVIELFSAKVDRPARKI